MTSGEHDVVVIGAGMAGLSCARLLTAAGRSVVVVEKSDGIGGRVRTDLVDGFRLDRGFQILLTAYPELTRWFDFSQLDLCAFLPGATVFLGGKFTTIGDPRKSPKDLPATMFGPVGTFADRLRLLKLLVDVRRQSVPALLRAPDKSTKDELEERHFSQSFIQHFFSPLFAGIQLDPDLQVSSRRFNVILRMLATGKSVVPAAGMGELSRRLSASVDVRCDHEVSSVNRNALGRWEVQCQNGENFSAPALVVATDGPTANRLIGIKESGSSPVAAIWFETTEAPLLDRHILLDGAASGPMKNLAALSAVAPEYAPPQRHLAVAAIPGPSALEPDLEQQVRHQLQTWLPASQQWSTLRVDVIRHGQPTQLANFSPKKNVYLQDNLWVCGDHRDTASIQGALYSGRRCAESILSHA